LQTLIGVHKFSVHQLLSQSGKDDFGNVFLAVKKRGRKKGTKYAIKKTARKLRHVKKEDEALTDYEREALNDATV
jgi:hypothetical protein